MKILMTGSTGFTGQTLLPMLESNGYDIWHLVRNKKGFKNEVIWDFVSPLPVSLPPCNVVIHLAAHVNFDRNLEIRQYNVNTVSTIKLAAYCKDHQAYLVFASMVGVHGSQNTVIDDNSTINPDNHYAVSKYLAEEVVKTYLQNYCILRICGIYGLNGPEHLGLNIAINNAVHKKMAPVLKGSGSAKRNYICVSDVGRWIVHLINNYDTMLPFAKAATREIIFLAGPEIMTIKQYLEQIADILLAGKELEMANGLESQDVIVKSSKAPFSLFTFRQYLRTLTY